MQKICGKQQWMTYARPDISYATKELARSLTQLTTLCQKLKHLLWYIKGTEHYRFYVRPIVRTIGATPDLNIFVHSDWAGRATTRKSTPGSVIKFMGSTIHFGSREQATIALSSAEAVRYAINTGAHQEPPTGSTPHQEGQRQDPHKLFEQAKHVHKNWSLKESKAHRAQTPFHRSNTFSSNNLRNMTPRGPPRSLQYGQQHRGHLRRSTLRAHSPALLANTNSSKGFTAARTQACTRVCTCEQRPQRTHTDMHFSSHGVDKGRQHPLYHKDLHTLT